MKRSKRCLFVPLLGLLFGCGIGISEELSSVRNSEVTALVFAEQAGKPELDSAQLFGVLKSILSVDMKKEDFAEIMRKNNFVTDGSYQKFNDERGKVVVLMNFNGGFFITFIPKASPLMPDAVFAAILSKASDFHIDDGDSLVVNLHPREFADKNRVQVVQKHLYFSLSGHCIRTSVTTNYKD